MNKNEKYPNGYLPKIQYWAGQVQEAAYLNEPEKIPYMLEKLTYFVKKEEERHSKRAEFLKLWGEEYDRMEGGRL